MRSTLGAAISMLALTFVLVGCGGGAPVSRTTASPPFDVSTASPPATGTPGGVASPSATPSATPCTGNYALPGLCGVGRQATAEEFAAMVAVGAPAVEKALGYKDWSACSNGENCFKVGTAASSLVGTNAGVFDGGYGIYPQGGLGAGCWVFLYQDSNGWHYLNSGCAQNPGFVPGSADSGTHVFVTGCANFRSAPGLSSNVLGCLGNGTKVGVDSAPVYADGHIWWHLAGHGWMAHDFLCEVCRI
jgi:hypothetical protein